MIKRENIDSSNTVRRAVEKYRLDLSSMNAGILNYSPMVTGIKGNPRIGYTLTIEDRYQMIPRLEMFVHFEQGELRRVWNGGYLFNDIYNTKNCLLMYLYSTDKDVYKKAATATTNFLLKNELLESTGRGYKFATDSEDADYSEGFDESEKYESRTRSREPLKPQRTRAQTMPKITKKSIFGKKKTARRR